MHYLDNQNVPKLLSILALPFVCETFCRTFRRIGATSEGNSHDERADIPHNRLFSFIWRVHVHKNFCSLFE